MPDEQPGRQRVRLRGNVVRIFQDGQQNGPGEISGRPPGWRDDQRNDRRNPAAVRGRKRADADQSGAACSGRSDRDRRPQLVADDPQESVQRNHQQRLHRRHRDGGTGSTGVLGQTQPPEHPRWVWHRLGTARQGQARPPVGAEPRLHRLELVADPAELHQRHDLTACPEYADHRQPGRIRCNRRRKNHGRQKQQTRRQLVRRRTVGGWHQRGDPRRHHVPDGTGQRQRKRIVVDKSLVPAKAPALRRALLFCGTRASRAAAFRNLIGCIANFFLIEASLLERCSFQKPRAGNSAVGTQSKGPVMRRLLLASVVLAAMLASASSASAALTGEWTKFAKCPTGNPSVELCVYANTTSGSFKMGQKTVPIVKPVVLQGGAIPVEPGNVFGALNFVAASDGNTLSKTPQPVPGGLTGIVAPSWWPQILKDLFNETINNGFTGVTGTVELAGPASAIKLSLVNTLTAKGVALGMPVKVKLDNPFLGSSCYIGSNSSPIQLNLTSGTTAPPPPNTPISGSPGELTTVEEGQIIAEKNNKLVDNAFSTPGANGCGGFLFSWLVDPFVNSIVGVPSAAGTNTAILEGSTYLGEAAKVRERQ